MKDISLAELRSNTDVAGKLPFSRLQARFEHISRLQNLLRKKQKNLEKTTILKTLPLRAIIASKQGQDFLEVMKLELGRDLAYEALTKKLEPDKLLGVASQVFKELQLQGLHPTVEKFEHGPLGGLVGIGYSHYALVIRW